MNFHFSTMVGMIANGFGLCVRFLLTRMFKFITNVIGKLAYIPCYNQCGLLA